MKALLLTYIFSLLLIISYSQSIELNVISTAGDYFEGANASLSWTLGEIVTETYSNNGITLTQGFQQPSISIHGINLDVLVFLEGPYNEGTMGTQLKDEGLIPLNQPYNTSPWNYEGTEQVSSIPENVVDWVLVELRDASSANQALSSTTVETKAAFILNDGTVVDIDGTSVLQFTSTINSNPFIIVWHLNHLGVLSANPPDKVGGIYTYDFSTSLEQAHGAGLGYKLVDAGIYGMVGGDVDGNGIIGSLDQSSWEAESGKIGFKNEDANRDSQVNNKDKNDLIIENQGISSQVPD